MNDTRATLRFSKWGYAHACRNNFAVRNLDLTIHAGERVLLLGASGIGKSTILEGAAGLIGNTSGSAKTQDDDGGICEGSIYIDNKPLAQARGDVALVMQDPNAQMIFEKLGDNVAFGCENLGVQKPEIWKRVHTSLQEVGLQDIQLQRNTGHLSGGQMQRLALAGALAMRPRILLLDEPTANLDPVGTKQIVAATHHVLKTTNATMMLVEHHIQPWLDIVNRVIILGQKSYLTHDEKTRERLYTTTSTNLCSKDDNQTIIVADGTPDEVFSRTDLPWKDLGIWVPRVYQQKQSFYKQKQSFALDLFESNSTTSIAPHFQSTPSKACPANTTHPLLLSAHNLAIGRTDTPIATHINMDFRAGEAYAFIGENGTGKTTLALTIAGLLNPICGELHAHTSLCEGLDTANPLTWNSRDLAQRISYVFQNPEHQFARSTVLDEVMLGVSLSTPTLDICSKRERARTLLKTFRLDSYEQANPYTLSGGEKRRLTVAAALAAQPKILILDEPTYGQDYKCWTEIVKLLQKLKAQGICIVVVTHDKLLIKKLHAHTILLTQKKSRIPQCIQVTNVNERTEEIPTSSVSPFLASLNPATRMFGALIFAIPLLFTLDWVSATCALILDFIACACINIKPCKVIKLSWPVWIGAPSSALAVWLYGKSGGATWFDWGFIHISDLSSTLALATAIRILAIGVPSIVTVIGIDATALADAWTQLVHLPDRFVYGGLAGMRLLGVLQEDWTALCAARRSRGIGDKSFVKAFFPQAFALFVLSIRRSVTLAKAMQARGFGSSCKRTHARTSTTSINDRIFIAFCLIIPLCAIMISVYAGTFLLFGCAPK